VRKTSNPKTRFMRPEPSRFQRRIGAPETRRKRRPTLRIRLDVAE
jgi:hypothetical protein